MVSVPGRVNLIGDHTDTTGGLVCPMAIDRGTVLHGRRGGDRVRLRSDALPGVVDVPLAGGGTPCDEQPAWGRYVAGVLATMNPQAGFEGEVRSDLPVGAGLSSSASLCVALALALGWRGDALSLARLVADVERVAAGVPCGLMDPLACAAGVAGAALCIDTSDGTIRPMPLPDDVDVVLVDSGESRSLADSPYAARRAEAEAAATALGGLRGRPVADAEGLDDPLLRRRARHVLSENRRVEAFAAALRAGDSERAGQLMTESHTSLREDMQVSTPVLDATVERLLATPGVLGARLTGAGFGGSVVAWVRAGMAVVGGVRVRASAGPLAEPRSSQDGPPASGGA
jgi:galactokinase